MIDFDKVRNATKSIYVYNTDKRKPVLYKATSEDDLCKQDRSYVVGSGRADKPYCYRTASTCSPHFALINMWYYFHPDSDSPEVFASVMGVLVIFTHDGIRALDGTFTKLKPR